MNEQTKLELLKLSIDLTGLIVSKAELPAKLYPKQEGFSLDDSPVAIIQRAAFEHLSGLLTAPDKPA